MNATRERLDALLASRDPALARSQDPVELVHRHAKPREQELVGLIAASLAFGNALAARRSIERALDLLGPEPVRTVNELSAAELRRKLRGFVHRIYRGEHLAVMLSGAGKLFREHGTLGEAFGSFHEAAEGDFREALARFADALRGRSKARSVRHLISDPRAGSACKRLLLYARWMIRPADGVDLGLWSISPAELVIPVDTHIHRISRNLGLTERATANWATAEEITAALRVFDPKDPVKYDFALCHLGVSRACPSRPDPVKCEGCVLRDVCRVWKTRPRRTSSKKHG